MLTTETERCRLGEFATWFREEPFFQTYSEIPENWEEEQFTPVEPYTDEELWNAEGNPVHVSIGGYPCEMDGFEFPETLPDDEPGDFARIIGSLTKRPAIASEISDSIVLTGYAHCTFDEYPDLSPHDREDIRQELALGLCRVASNAVANGKPAKIRQDILRHTRDRLVARVRRESSALPCVAVANEHAAAEAREALELERMARQANAWQMHLAEMERLNQQKTPELAGVRLL